METAVIVDRLMKMTGDWSKTFELIDRYPIHGTPVPQEQVADKIEQLKLEPKIEVIPEKRKKLRIKKGSLKENIIEVLEQFPGSTVNEIVTLAGREPSDSNQVQARCKMLLDDKLLVRSKNDQGKYVYRLPRH